MIEVEIRGPLSKEHYGKLKKLLEGSGENPRCEKRIFIDYSTGLEGDSLENRTLDVRLKQKNDIPEIVIKKGKKGDWTTREELVTTLAPGEFSNGVSILAALGYTKGMVCVRDMLHARYGGAEFSLVDTGEDTLCYYEAEIVVDDPVQAEEAKQKLETLVKKLKLPVWNQNEMFAFIRKLNDTVNYMYDHDTHGKEHFREKWGI